MKIWIVSFMQYDLGYIDLASSLLPAATEQHGSSLRQDR